MKVAALFIDPRGPYANLPGVDQWPAERDARKYRGPWPVVAHPPCERWGRYATGGPNPKARRRKKGDDGGCFAAALEAVRKYGGVVEHPAGSYAWAAFNLPRPTGIGWQLSFFDPGWVCEVSQRAYGHRAEKLTWLYYIGEAPPPELDWRRPRGEALVSFLSNHGCRDLPRLRSAEASVTPPPFRRNASSDRTEREVRMTTVELMGHRERMLTPEPFRDVLLEIAKGARPCPR